MLSILISTANESKTNNGVFEGWGTSLCWWANRVGHSEKLTQDSARLFFSEEGLGLNIMRYNIGGGDDPTHDHIRRTDSEMPGWWKYDKNEDRFVFNSDTDHSQLNVLLSSYKAAGKEAFVEAFSNSPPYYMTESGCTSGNTPAARDNLKASCIDDFAQYLAEACQYINNTLNIKIKSLAAMNEPFSNYWHKDSPKQEGCFISPGKMQSDILISVSDALHRYELDDIILTASDETNCMLQYISIKMLSEEALSRVSRISTHTYAKALPHIGELSRKLSKNIWMDETDWSGVAGEDSGEMGPALWLSEKIIEDINTLSPSAWVIWQIVASYISTVPDSKGRLDMPAVPDLTQGFWGTAFADIDNEAIILTQKYYAFGQFSKFIRPGMTVIHTDNNRFLAAYDKKSGKTVIVAVNDKNQEENVSFSFNGIDTENKTVRSVRTSGDKIFGEHWNELPQFYINGNFNISLTANSITTFIIE